MKTFSLALLLTFLAGCTPATHQNNGVYMLLDTSGTYREELRKAEQIIRYTLSRLDATDTFAVARIDTGSFSEKDIVAKASLLQAIEYLNEKDTGKKTILIFSDLKEDLQDGYIRDIDFELDGFNVIALNVTKLRSDNIDPREYLSRLDEWQARIEKSGGKWRVINDLDGLEGLL